MWGLALNHTVWPVYMWELVLNHTDEEFEDIKGSNHNPSIEEEQTTQWPNEKRQMHKQQSTKYHTEN
jgi:hypothetical protein